MRQCVLCRKKTFHILFDHHKNWKVGKCGSCGLVQVVPMPTNREVASLYHEDMEHFEPYIEQLPVHRAYFKEKLHQMKAKLSSKGRVSLLDIGCAMGVLLSHAKQAGWQAVGVDLSADAVSYCRQHGLTVYAGTVYSVKNLRENSFDVVSGFEVIEHERDPLGMMRRVYKLLKTDGIAVVTTPNHSSFWRITMGKWWLGYQHPEHLVFFGPETLKLLLEQAGFRKVEVKKDIPRPFPLSFALARSADYFPVLAWFLRPVGKLVGVLGIRNPFNPWDDIIAIGRK